MKSVYMEAVRKMKRMCMLSVVILLLATFTVGCTLEKPETDVSSNCRLKLTVEVSDEPFYTHISADELGTAYDNEILYHSISKVSIEIDGAYVDLVEAIHDGKVTPEEIVAYAKIDARNGQCEMQYQSEVGYAHYSYIYEDFELVTAYDVFEAPNGNDYHVEDLTIGLPGYTENTGFDYPVVKAGDEWLDLGQEDWGVTFEPIEATATTLNIRCMQAGGQHFGKLIVTDYELWRIEENNWDRCSQKEDWADYPYESTEIIQDDTTEFTVDWSGQYGKLPCGTYSLAITIEDDYEQTHAFMKNYKDKQRYTIEFSITE